MAMIFAVAAPHHRWQTLDTTSYSPCSSGTITASGQRVAFGMVATRVTFARPVYGRRVFVVTDRMAPGDAASIDVFSPSCSEAIDFGAERLLVTFSQPPR